MRSLRLLSMGAIFLASSLNGEVQEETDSLKGCTIQYNAAISSSKIWVNFDGEQEYVFTLSDTSRWMTTSQEAFRTVIADRWSVGDHLTIKLTDNFWIAANAERTSEVLLTPLCNK